MKDIIIFDVDGTLVESSKTILPVHAEILNKLKEKYTLAICGGGTKEKILKQMNEMIVFDHYFSECGCVYHKKDNKNNLIEIYRKNIRNHPFYEKINLLIKESLLFFSNVNYTLTGHLIDLRDGLIYISCIGMQANEEERKYFKEYDSIHKVRETLIDGLKKKAIQLGIYEKINIKEGGTVGIAIYPSEWDKIQILEIITKKDYNNIIYFGDRFNNDGNDYLILNSAQVIGHKINCVEETYDILRNTYL
tara:strand:+ start:8313 stop:9059 length:747 start_codon:yes stop_codon:yes gene_type:complete